MRQLPRQSRRDLYQLQQPRQLQEPDRYPHSRADKDPLRRQRKGYRASPSHSSHGRRLRRRTGAESPTPSIVAAAGLERSPSLIQQRDGMAGPLPAPTRSHRSRSRGGRRMLSKTRGSAPLQLLLAGPVPVPMLVRVPVPLLVRVPVPVPAPLLGPVPVPVLVLAVRFPVSPPWPRAVLAPLSSVMRPRSSTSGVESPGSFRQRATRRPRTSSHDVLPRQVRPSQTSTSPAWTS